MQPINYQEELGQFFRMARGRLTPAEVGFKENSRRRTPGLRREEVAQLASVSVSWYTNIEQGKNVQPSDEIISDLANALKLTSDERRYVFSLLHAEKDDLSTQVDESLEEDLQTLLKALDPNPSYILDLNWDIYSWNRSAIQILGLPEQQNKYERINLVHWFLTDIGIRNQNENWEAVALSMIARFRLTVANHIQDTRTQEIIAKLRHDSTLFDEHWDNYTIEDINTSRIFLNHPEFGRGYYRYISLELTKNPDIKVMSFILDKLSKD